MKKKTSIKLMAATVLAATILLGACGNKKETTQANSSAKTSQLSRSETVSSKKENETQKSSGATVVEKSKVSPNQSSTAEIKSQVKPASEPKKVQEVSNQKVSVQTSANQQAIQSQANQKAYNPATDRKLQDKQAESNKRYKGVLTMVDGDFSSAVGNWKGANGETITVSSGGKFTVETADGKKENYSIKGYSS